MAAPSGTPSHSLLPEASSPSSSSKSASLIHEGSTFPVVAKPETKHSSSLSLPSALEPAKFLSRIKLVDIIPEEGTPSDDYMTGVADLFGSLARHGAAVIELNAEDSALVRCCIESAKLYFRTRSQSDSISDVITSTSSPDFAGFAATGSSERYHYRAGRHLVGEDVKNPPPCMPDVFRCLGRASRIMLGAICRKLQLRSDAFSPLLDDFPLGISDSSASILVATHFRNSGLVGASSPNNDECSPVFDEGFLSLVACDFPGLQICDSNGSWYLADVGIRTGDLLVLAGKALERMTSGLCSAHPYRLIPLSSSTIPGSSRRLSLTFHLMPRAGATLDGSVLKEAGYSISEDFGPVVVSKFLEKLGVLEAGTGSRTQTKERRRRRGRSEQTLKTQQTLRSLLRDPLTGTILEDAYTAADCGHTFGGETLKRVKETKVCSLCGAAVNVESMIPNLALRAAALAYHKIARRRKTKIGSRKRRNELREHGERLKTMKTLKTLKAKRKRSKLKKDDSENVKEVNKRFLVNEKVIIKGNKRTPEKFVGKEAIITSKCLNGWYLLKLVDNGERVRLQSRSMQAIPQCDESPDVKPQQSSDCMDS